MLMVHPTDCFAKECGFFQGPQSPKNPFNQEHRTQYHRASSATSSTHSSKTANSATTEQSNSKSGKQKLPHGLTVHELKEMTKARLQAEAAEKHDSEPAEFSAESRRGVSPLDFDSSTELRERALSRDSTGRHNQMLMNNGTASDTMAAIPSLVQVNPPTRELNTSRQAHKSPLPPGFQNFVPAHPVAPTSDSAGGIIAPTPARDAWQHQPRPDNWESASVASHNSTAFSEGLGSEPALAAGLVTGLPQQSEAEMAGIPFTRSHSYSLGQNMGADVSSQGGRSTPTSASASPRNNANPFFDAAPGAVNRRRAYTTSPKPGSIREDGPHFIGEDLRMPSFASNAAVTLTRSRNTDYSPAFGQLCLGLP